MTIEGYVFVTVFTLIFGSFGFWLAHQDQGEVFTYRPSLIIFSSSGEAVSMGVSMKEMFSFLFAKLVRSSLKNRISETLTYSVFKLTSIR